jgi:predicted amino acid-binding ACT domain protein
MGLLEDECDTLNRRIVNFQNANAADSSDSDSSSSDSEDSEAEPDEGVAKQTEGVDDGEGGVSEDANGFDAITDAPVLDIASIESAISDVMANQIIPQGMSELLQSHQRGEAKLRDTLENNRTKQTKRLEERLKKREQDRLARLQAQGMSKKEAELLVAAEIDEERGAEEENIAKDAADEQMAFALTALKELVDKSSQEAAALEMDMAAEMERRRAQIRHEVEDAMRSREKQIMLEQGITAKAARAIVQEEEDALIDQKESEAEQAVLQDLEERRTAMLHTIRLAHEREQARVDEANKQLHEMQKRALQLRLEGRKKLRVHELMKKNVSLEEATKIANDEADRELRLAEKTIAKSTDTTVQTTKAKIVESMREAHERETHRLAEDLKHVEERRKIALQNRLQEREKRRAKALQAEGVSEAKANSIAKEEMEKTQVQARAALEEEIKVKREAHIKEAERLMDVMATKKETASKDLQDRLAKRKAQNAAKAAEAEAKAKETPAQKLDKYLKQLRETHRQSINRVNQFINAQKKVAIQKAEALDALGETPGGNLSSRLAEISAMFSVVKDGLQTGFRKQCVYEIRAVKESNNLRPLSNDERRLAIRDGTSQLMMRYAREMKSLFELQLAEKHRARQKLIEDGAPQSKILSLESRFEDRILENICKQQNKALMSLCGLVMDVSLLDPPGGPKEGGAMSTKSAPVDADGDLDDVEAQTATDALSDGENDFESTFDIGVMTWFQGIIQLQHLYNKPPFVLVHRLSSALNHIVTAIEELAHSSDTSFKKDDIESAIAVYCASGSLSLKFLLEAFLPHILQVCDIPLTSEAQMSLLKKSISSIASSSENQKALEVANKSKSAQEKVRNLFGNEMKLFLEEPFIVVENKPTPAPGTRVSSAKSGQDRRGDGDDLRRREEQLMKALESKLEKKRKEMHDYFRRSRESRAADLLASGNLTVVGADQTEQEFATMETETLNRLNEAFEEIRGMVFTGSTSSMELLNFLSAEGLMAAIESRLEGNDVSVRDLKMIQTEVEKDLERKEATRLRKAQSAEAEKLDVMLKVQRAREQQALQKRLLARKNKNKNASNQADQQ